MPTDILRFKGVQAYNLIIEQPIKLLTIRAAQKNYQPGDVVQAVFPDVGHEGGSDPVPRIDQIRIISQVAEQIGQIHPALLLMDGFLESAEVAEMMDRQYPEQAPWTEESLVWRTFFVPACFAETDLVKQMRLFHGQAYYGKPDFELDLIRDPLLSDTFIWAVAYWWIEHHDLPLDAFPQALQEREMIDADKALSMQQMLREVYALGQKKSKKAQREIELLLAKFLSGQTD